MEAIVYPGHALIVIDHECGAIFICLLTCGFKGTIRLHSAGNGKLSKQVDGVLLQVILERRAKEPRPNFVNP